MDEGPIRTCVGCRARRPQDELIRIVASPGGTLEVDAHRHRSPGRGAYLCRRRSCIDRALDSGALGRSLRYGHAPPSSLREDLLALLDEKS